MNVWITFRVAMRALARHKLRSTLTMLGVIIGVSAVITTVSIGSGARASVQKQLDTIGSNFILILAGNQTSGGTRGGWGTATTLIPEDANAIMRECPAVYLATPSTRTWRRVIYGNQNWWPRINGVGAEYPDIRQWPMSDGKFFSQVDVESNAKVAVLGQTVIEKLFGDEVDPIGQFIRIEKAPYKVIGVLERKGQSIMGEDQDDIVFLPHTTCLRRIQNQPNIGALIASAVSSDRLAEAQLQITELLRQRHRIAPGADDDFMVRNQVEITQAATMVAKLMGFLLASVASIALLVGGIGIMNIMLVSVTERTREIGIRMAVGARGRDILLQFLVEAVTLSVLGGVIGILLGAGVSSLIPQLAMKFNPDIPIPTVITTESVLISVGFAALIGIFFGWYPARKAARLDPIEALRYE